MNLHENEQDFEDLIRITARWRGIPEDACRRDYYIVRMLKRLSDSEYADQCVFKGGTSLSKCYPGSIERFSEDIDLTYIPEEGLKNKQYDRRLKSIEMIMSEDASLEKIPEERNDRNKSSYVWFDERRDTNGRIKLEIGSSARPDPYEKRTLKTYIQEYLEMTDADATIQEYGLKAVSVNTLRIERTFLDKVMCVKRHAYCGTLPQKVRHIYDVKRLLDMDIIQEFLENKEELKRLIVLTKDTDTFYLEKRGIAKVYNPKEPYAFDCWSNNLDKEIRQRYESLHTDLLYTDVQQNFDEAIDAFCRISRILEEIGE